MIAVRDSGIGIDDHAQIRLFERFKQATPKTEGTYGGSGLGLNVSRKLCHLHGGEIGVSSKEGQGSTFCFFFRVRNRMRHWGDGIDMDDISDVDRLSHDIQAVCIDSSGAKELPSDVRIPKDPPESEIEELSRGGPSDERTTHTKEIARKAASRITGNDAAQNFIRSILVVEDKIINWKMLTRKLKSLGFGTVEATNSLEALDAFQSSRPDCILMDQEMPLMDGNAATKHIRDLEEGGNNHIPILRVTANVRSAQKSEMLQAGMDDVIHKHFSTEELIAKISQFVPTKLETKIIDISVTLTSIN
ncbi:hypothetical protein N7478_010275 [Penicillium angulare]|uniref:uncharacterized protein n=1 Tax=Penicillium angulare TaxID=116970 RepID=UPI002541AAE4|nr:uncharacterized protein N7478_010275 [Penicillium angulare]KAJ5267467.1 hypothetical protein N7478_010275 [Penicillium angulare]